MNIWVEVEVEVGWSTFSQTARVALPLVLSERFIRGSREAEEDNDGLVLSLTSGFFLGALIHAARSPFWEGGDALGSFLSSVELLAEAVRQVGTSGPAVGSIITCF